MVEPSSELQLIFEKSIQVATKLKHEYLTIEHLLFAMLCEESFVNCITGFGADSEYLKKNLEHFLKHKQKEITTTEDNVKPRKTQSVERVLNRAFTQVLFNGRQKIEATDVFVSMMGEKRSYAFYYIQQAGIDKDKFNDYISNEVVEVEEEQNPMDQQGDRALRAFTTNLNEAVKKNKIDPVIGRIEELENVALALGRRSKSNVILVGDPGVGKTAIAEGLAFNIVKGAVPEFLKEYAVYNLDSTTWEEYRKYFEKDRALMRRFQRITIEEPTAEMTGQILKGIKKYYEQYHNVKIKDDAIQAAIKLSVKYQADKKLPDKAIDLIDCACSRFNLKAADTRTITSSEIEFELSKMINMPAETIAEQEATNLATLEDKIKSDVYGQDTAVQDIVDKILVSRAGLKPDNKPVGSFVFMGPTGTGKTETAKALAKHLGVKLIRFDMSEYQEKHSISKLIGSPPGYVGFEENAGLLITQIQENPNCVLLLDEVEKSHPDVSTILLQIMDNGFVTGSNGKKADCRNIILILTTNAGAQEAEKNAIGFGSQEKTYQDKELKKFFAPEFRNRLDGVVTFDKLAKETMIKIVGKFMSEVRDQVKEKGVKLKINAESVDWLVERGFDKKMGARPLQRVIDKEIKRPLAKMMLFGELRNGGIVSIVIENNSVVLKPKLKNKVVENEVLEIS